MDDAYNIIILWYDLSRPRKNVGLPEHDICTKYANIRESMQCNSLLRNSPNEYWLRYVVVASVQTKIVLWSLYNAAVVGSLRE